MAGGFIQNTRRRLIPVAGKTTTSSAGSLQFNPLPRNGFLARIYLLIRGSITSAGGVSALNAQGKASIISSVTLTVNSSQRVFRLSGFQYHHLFRNFVEAGYTDIGVGSDALSPVATGAFNLDMVIPIAMDLRDSIGIILNQNEQMTLDLTVELASQASVATGIDSWTCTVTPIMEVFTVPLDRNDWPDLNLLHTVLGESTAIAATGDFEYVWPRGNVVLQMIHGLGNAANNSGGVDQGADAFSRYVLLVNHADQIETIDTPSFADRLYAHQKGRARRLGTAHFDLMGSSGLGNYGLLREPFNTRLVTDLSTVLTVTSTGTLHTIRRELVQLAPAR